MKFVSKHKLLVMFAALAFILSAEPAAAATGSFEQSLSVDGPIVLDVSTGSGAINIRGGSGRRVEIIGHIKASNRGFLGLFRKSNADVQELIDQLEANPPIEVSHQQRVICTPMSCGVGHGAADQRDRRIQHVPAI